jgi:succinate dehydrogenase/fumarate reductase flavoprotein subunit
VVLAAGGFEWNDEMAERFLSGPIQTRCGTPHNVGDGHRMGMAVGADLAGMNEAWWGVMADLPGLEVDGEPVGQLFTIERCLPGTLIVNRRGERFMNESKSYYGIGKIFATWDQVEYGYRNLPCYLIGDGRFLSTHGILGHDDAEHLPPAIVSAPTSRALAGRLGVDADGLAATVDRFNAHAREGRDPDFRRGESAYEHYLGDASATHPNLAPLEQSPFVAIEVRAGAIGTKGGIRTDAQGRALDPFGEVIPGLFAVGNNSAHPVAFGYAGAGSTLGPGMTMAYVAGSTAVASLPVRAR